VRVTAGPGRDVTQGHRCVSAVREVDSASNDFLSAIAARPPERAASSRDFLALVQRRPASLFRQRGPGRGRGGEGALTISQPSRRGGGFFFFFSFPSFFSLLFRLLLFLPLPPADSGSRKILAPLARPRRRPRPRPARRRFKANVAQSSSETSLFSSRTLPVRNLNLRFN